MDAPNRKVTFKVAASIAVLVAGIMASLDTNEGRLYVPYWDSLGEVWTVCRGITGPEVIPSKTYTSAECDKLEGEYVARMLS
jgi:lysozyme